MLSGPCSQTLAGKLSFVTLKADLRSALVLNAILQCLHAWQHAGCDKCEQGPGRAYVLAFMVSHMLVGCFLLSWGLQVHAAS